MQISAEVVTGVVVDLLPPPAFGMDAEVGNGEYNDEVSLSEAFEDRCCWKQSFNADIETEAEAKPEPEVIAGVVVIASGLCMTVLTDELEFEGEDSG